MLVIGGGPAGLSSAIAARANGLDVTLVDSRTPPIDKACGEGLLPEAVVALGRLGVDLSSASPVAWAGIRFSDNSSSIRALFPRGRALGLRRTALHEKLADRARAMGVSLAWGRRVSGFDGTAARVDGEWIRARFLIGADGQQSNVRRFARLGHELRGPRRFGFRRHYAIAPWSDLVEVYWGEHCQMVVTPTGQEEVCISVFSRDLHLRVDRAFDEFPEVASRLENRRAASTEAGATTSLGWAPSVTHGRIALVGDASGTVDGIAGQGLSLAFQQALALGEALGRGDLRHYASAHRRVMRTAARMTALLLLMGSSTRIRQKVLRLFVRCPALFSRLISIHAGPASAEALRATEILALGWRVLRA